VGIIGAVYFSGSLLYGLFSFVAGPLADRLVKVKHLSMKDCVNY